MAIKSQPFYAVRVAIYTENGTETRDYVRGEWRIGKDKFDSFALGDMLNLVTKPGQKLTWRLTQVSHTQVVEASKYEHLTNPGFHA